MLIQRAIEMAGIPTVLITTDPANSAAMRPPRALCPEGFHWGHSLGRAADRELQRAVLITALQQLGALHLPGAIVTQAFPAYAAAAAAVR